VDGISELELRGRIDEQMTKLDMPPDAPVKRFWADE
jgi:hypothetical protein